MKRFIPQLVGFALAVALTVNARAADPHASATKAREALTALQTGTPAEKALACKRLAIYGDASAVPALAALLDNEQLAAWARTALEAIPGRAADKALRDAAGRLQGTLLVGVINSIGVRRDTGAIRLLARKLKDADPEVASAAAIALGRIGGRRAAAILEKHLASASPPVANEVARACVLCAERFLAEKQPTRAVRLYDRVRAANVPKQRILEATRGAILARGREGLPLLLETLRSPDRDTFRIGLSVARELPGLAVSDALAAELRAAPPERRGLLLMALADRNDAAAWPVVRNTAASGEKALRIVAIEAIARLANPDGAPVLLDAATDADAQIAEAAKTALGSLPADIVNPEITARLPRATSNARRVLIRLAGERQIAAALPEMIRAARDNDSRLRAAGIKALGETVEAKDLGALTDLLAGATEDDLEAIQDALETACTRIKDKDACAAKLLPLLSGAAPSVKPVLLHALGAAGTPAALDAVKSALQDANDTVRDAALRALANWSEPLALPTLLELFRTTQNDAQRALLVRGCVRLLEADTRAAAEKVNVFRDLLAGTQRAADRKVILSGLANVADPGALELVQPLLDDAEVKAEAKLAADKITAAIKKAQEAAAKAKK
ncbi:MAG: HEAT repeat domain-containing protein [Verrucomicrobiales bacterium]|nr:HEAT repeat domain-containing protein [Verrucomicrobiales bacterium]